MNEGVSTSGGRPLAWAAGIVGTFLLMGLMVYALVKYTQPADLTAARAAERAKFLQDQRQLDAQAISGYAWQDPTKEIVRLPIERAMEIVVQEWRKPSAARSNLIARVTKAAEPPPKPPEAPNPYE